MKFFSCDNILENIYYFSNIGIFFVSVGLGILTFTYTRKQNKNKIEEAKRQRAFELCNKYDESLQKKYFRLWKQINKLKIDFDLFSNIKIYSIQEKNILLYKNEVYKKINKELKKEDKLYDRYLDLANELEKFALPFYKNLACIETAVDFLYFDIELYVKLCNPYFRFCQKREEIKTVKSFYCIEKVYQKWIR